MNNPLDYFNDEPVTSHGSINVAPVKAAQFIAVH